MVDITVNVRIENQEKLQSLLRGLDVTTLACKEEHFAEFKDLVDGEMYQPGKPFTRPGRGRRLSGLRTARPTKKQKVQPHHARGPLSDRAQDKKRAQNESLFAEAEPYKDTIWLRARGHMVPMSMDKYHLQRRFERLHDKIDELKEVNAEQEEQLSTISEHEAAAKKREDKLTKKIDALEADISQLMEDVSDEENEVTFKSEGEYDPAFVLCMMFALAFTSYRIAFDIIKFVFETLTGKKMTDHPGTGFKHQCFTRMDVLCHMQVAEALVAHNERNIAVGHDGSTKKGLQLSASVLFLPQQAYSLGIVAVPDATAVSMFTSFLRVLTQTLATIKKGTRKDICDSLLKMNQSLSDRCPTEIKWIQLFEEKKLEEISREYTNLSRVEQEQMARVYAFFCMAHCLSGMSAVVEKMFKEDRKGASFLYPFTCFTALREISKTFHPQSSWGFMLFVPYSDFCRENGFGSLHDFMQTVGRFVGSRHHNQLLPCARISNAVEGLIAFITSWERRKAKQKPNRMFSSNLRAMRCERTKFEWDVATYVYTLLVAPMLLCISGTSKSNISIVSLLAALLPAMEKATVHSVRSALDSGTGLVKQFARARPLRIGLEAFVRSMEFLSIQDASSAREFARQELREADWRRFSILYRESLARAAQRQLIAQQSTPAGHARPLQRVVVDATALAYDRKILAYVVRALPRMAIVCRERQPHIVPGGEYTELDAKQAEICTAPATTDVVESGFGIYTYKIRQSPMMLPETASTHVMLRQNHFFQWLTALPREERDAKIRVSGKLAAQWKKERLLRREELQAARVAKFAQEDERAERKEQKREGAWSLLWQTVQQMDVALRQNNGHERSEQQQKTIIRTQLTSWQQCDLWKPPKGFSVSKTSLRDFKTTIAGLIEGRFSAAASSSSSSSSSRAAADDSDDVDDIVHESGIQSDEDLVGDSMPCCGVVYAENGGYRVVSCSRCARWFHVGSLGKCKGDSNMLQCSDEPSSAFLCSGCSA